MTKIVPTFVVLVAIFLFLAASLSTSTNTKVVPLPTPIPSVNPTSNYLNNIGGSDSKSVVDHLTPTQKSSQSALLSKKISDLIAKYCH